VGTMEWLSEIQPVSPSDPVLDTAPADRLSTQDSRQTPRAVTVSAFTRVLSAGGLVVAGPAPASWHSSSGWLGWP